jgi:hypothetical protein
MKKQTLIHSSILAAVVIAAIIGVGMFTGLPGAKPFISVDPVSDKNVGDAFTITGTTNLPAGTDLTVQVYATSFEKKASDTGEFSGALGTVRVVSGTGGTNIWSMDVDSSVFVPMEYLVNASVFTGDPVKGDFSPGSPFGTTTFTLHPGSDGITQHSGHVVAGGILIDPLNDTTAGKLLTVTGKTNLSAGTDLMVKVATVSLQDGKIIADPQHTENVAVTRVVKSTGANNLFSVALDTWFLAPAEQIVTVSTMKDSTDGIGSGPGTFTSSQLFNIIADPAGTGQTRSIPAIYINPFGDVSAGDSLTVTGVTNVPAGSKFRVTVVPASSPDFEHPEFSATVSVVKGTASSNLFSVTLPTKDLPPGDHIIAVSAEGTEVTGTLLFTVK